MQGEDVELRFWGKTRQVENGCVVWVGAVDCGRGRFYVNGHQPRADIWIYERRVGVVPIGDDVKHACGNRLCMTVEHLSIEPRRRTEEGDATAQRLAESTRLNERGCQVWDGGKTTRGYGIFVVNGTHHYTHRWMYEYIVGMIPPGLQIDHLCRTPACINVRHLEPVTPKENVLRGCRSRAIEAGGVPFEWTWAPAIYEQINQVWAEFESTWPAHLVLRGDSLAAAIALRSEAADKRESVIAAAKQAHKQAHKEAMAARVVVYIPPMACGDGHAYTDENTYRTRSGGQVCRECHRVAARDSARRKARERAIACGRKPGIRGRPRSAQTQQAVV